MIKNKIIINRFCFIFLNSLCFGPSDTVLIKIRGLGGELQSFEVRRDPLEVSRSALWELKKIGCDENFIRLLVGTNPFENISEEATEIDLTAVQLPSTLVLSSLAGIPHPDIGAIYLDKRHYSRLDLPPGSYTANDLVDKRAVYNIGDFVLDSKFDLRLLKLMECVCAAKTLLKNEETRLTRFAMMETLRSQSQVEMQNVLGFHTYYYLLDLGLIKEMPETDEIWPERQPEILRKIAEVAEECVLPEKALLKMLDVKCILIGNLIFGIYDIRSVDYLQNNKSISLEEAASFNAFCCKEKSGHSGLAIHLKPSAAITPKLIKACQAYFQLIKGGLEARKRYSLLVGISSSFNVMDSALHSLACQISGSRINFSRLSREESRLLYVLEDWYENEYFDVPSSARYLFGFMLEH